MTISYKHALPYVSHVIDDALGVHCVADIDRDAVLIGWQCGFEPMFIAVQSYLPGITVDSNDAVDIATDYLVETHWFADAPTEPDYILRPSRKES